MSDNEKKSGFKFLEKLKKIKHIEVYIAIIFIVVLLLIYLGNFNKSNENIVLDKFPTIKGVLITAKGVNDTATKLKVLHAVEAVIDITNGNIEILSSE